MAIERDVLDLLPEEVPVIDGEMVTAIRTLAARGLVEKTVARELDVSINTVRRYVRLPADAKFGRRRASPRRPGGRRRGRSIVGQPPARVTEVLTL